MKSTREKDMSSKSSDELIVAVFPQAHSVNNLQDVDRAKSPIAWQIFDEFVGSTVNQHRQQIVFLFDDYCKQNPNAIDCSIYSS